LFFVVIVCLSVCVACLLQEEEAWFVNREDQELMTDSRSRSSRLKKEAKEF